MTQLNDNAEEQLRALYDEHAGALFGFTLRLTGGDRGRAEDIVQDTLVRAWQNRAALRTDTSTDADADGARAATDPLPDAADPASDRPPGLTPGSIRPWLFTVARRIAIDQHRRRSARPAEVGGQAADLALMSAADAADVEAGLDRIVVLDALSALSAEHRDVLMQTYYAGHTVAEAARHLGVPAGTVKSRTFYALKALRLALTERGVIA